MAEESVTQKDFFIFKKEMKSEFSLFQQEMKSEYQLFEEKINNKFELYLSNIDKRIVEVIDERFERIENKIEVIRSRFAWIVGVFAVAFFAYFEYMRTRVDQVNDNRLAKMEYVLETILVSKIEGDTTKDRRRQSPQKGTTNRTTTRRPGK